jgi:hypothetical protein
VCVGVCGEGKLAGLSPQGEAGVDTERSEGVRAAVAAAGTAQEGKPNRLAAGMGFAARVVPEAAAGAVLRPVFQGPEQPRAELFSTMFHGLVNLLVELFALTAAFVFFLSAESTKAVQNQIVSGVDQPQVLGAAAGAVQRLFGRACALGREAATAAPTAANDCCAPGGAVRGAAASLLAALDLAAPPAELGGDAADVQNLWVMRVAVLFCALGLVALGVAYLVTRLARGPRVPLGRIVLYNVLLFVFAFGVQVAFMGMVTLRYVPILPSDQLRALRRAVEAEEALANLTSEDRAEAATTLAFQAAGSAPVPAAGSAPAPAAGSGSAAPAPASASPAAAASIVPAAAGVSAALVVAMIAAVALILFLAWKVRAFRIVSTAQGLCIQLAFIFAVMVGVYFWLSNSIGAELQEAAIRETVTYVAQIARKAPGDDVARGVWASVRASLAEREAGAEAQDRGVRERNAAILRDVRAFALVMGGAFAAVVLLTALARRQAARPRFWLALLLVGLVGGSTTLLVEYGFAQNVLRNYRPVSAPRLARGVATALGSGVERHAQWFCEDARCGDPARALQNGCCGAGEAGPFAAPWQGDAGRWVRLAGGAERNPFRDVPAACVDDAVWSLEGLYADSARWFEDARELAVGTAAA